MIDQAWKETGEKAWEWLKSQEYDPTMIEDDEEVRRYYMEQWLGERGYDVYQLISDPLYARRAVLTEYLKDRGFNPNDILYFEDRSAVSSARRQELDANAITSCLQLWLESLGEIVIASSPEEIRKQAEKKDAGKRRADADFGQANPPRWEDR